MAKWEEAPEVDATPNTAPRWQAAPEVEAPSQSQPTAKPSIYDEYIPEEVALSMGTGAIAQPLAGLAGLASLVVPGVNSADVVKKVQNALTYQPRSSGAQKTLSAIAYPFEKLAQGSEYLGGVAGGDLGAAIGRTAGEALPLAIPGGRLATPVRAVAPETAALQANAAAARAAGYKIPPVMAGDPSTIANLLQGEGGKVKIQQGASIANQSVTNSLVKRDLGIPDDATITPELLDSLRKTAGKPYEDLKTYPGKFIADSDYIGGVHQIGAEVGRLADEFPDLASHKEIRTLISSLSRPDISPQNAVTLLKKLRFDAKANYANRENPAKLDLAKAQDQAAGLLEDLIDRNLQKTGDTDLLTNYRNARTQLAKIHTVDKIYNETTGTVPGQKLAGLLKKGAPLSGGMRTAAEFARTFEKAAQTPEMIGGVSHISPFDLGISAVGAAAGAASQGALGNIGALLPGIRPLSRKWLLSDMYQQKARPPGGVPPGPLTTVAPFLISPQLQTGE